MKISINPGAIISKAGNSEMNKKLTFKNFKPVIDFSKCTKCKKCWLYCPDAAFKKNSEGFYECVERHCKGCGLCAKICPVKCINMVEVKNEEN